MVECRQAVAVDNPLFYKEPGFHSRVLGLTTLVAKAYMESLAIECHAIHPSVVL